ncbi:hypothetical protein [Marilutibacter maris]|uniref:Uncharacterized protein n=1 Tax=Marilutibacter maris TaxID=1605891 RepID=A0A2U9TAI1_9GAMM|nr:hypothetical protein [Lysobacter maris]AWV07558.1 hypothetical protein C9I47_1869 [Lysobacter maris]
MAFVNEFIPEADVEKYGLKEIDQHFIIGGTNARDWTIDRERDIYLRNVANGREEFRSQTEWTFYWHGAELTLRLYLLEGKGGRGEAGWSHWKLAMLNGTNGLPEHLKAQKAQILRDLKDALIAYRGAGVYSAAYSDYSVTLDIGEECVL